MNPRCQCGEDVATEDGQSLPRSKAPGHQKQDNPFFNRDVLTHTLKCII